MQYSDEICNRVPVPGFPKSENPCFGVIFENRVVLGAKPANSLR